MTMLSTETTRTNRDLVIFSLVSAIISGFLSASFALFYLEKELDKRRDIHIEKLEQRIHELEKAHLISPYYNNTKKNR